MDIATWLDWTRLRSMMSASSPCSILFCLFWLFVLLCSLLTGVWRNGSDERETYFTAHGTPFFFELLFFFFFFFSSPFHFFLFSLRIIEILLLPRVRDHICSTPFFYFSFPIFFSHLWFYHAPGVAWADPAWAILLLLVSFSSTFFSFPISFHLVSKTPGPESGPGPFLFESSKVRFDVQYHSIVNWVANWSSFHPGS